MVPSNMGSVLDYRFKSLNFSRLELEIIKALISGKHKEAKKLAFSFGWLETGKEELISNRERHEMEEKLNIMIPWS